MKEKIFLRLLVLLLTLTACGEQLSPIDSATINDDPAISADGNLGNSLSPDEMQIKITAEDTEILAVLDDSALSHELAAALPATLSMTRLYEREYYGTPIDHEPSAEYETQVDFSLGDLAYWPRGNSLLLLFGYNAEHPTIDSGIVVIGKILTDLSVFDGLESTVDMTFSVQNNT